MTFEDVKKFHTDFVAGNEYNLLVLGSKDNIDLKSLAKYGEVVELSLTDLFGY